MKILEVEASDSIEQVIAQCNTSRLADTKKKRVELAALFVLLRHADAMFERPYSISHGDKPDFMLTTPKTVYGLEVTEVTTQGLKHAEKLHHSTYHGISMLADFLIENKREAKDEVLKKMQPNKVRPQSVSVEKAFNFWTQTVIECIVEKGVKRDGYSVDFDQFGLILIDGLSFDQREMSERTGVVRTLLMEQMKKSHVQLIYFCTHNRAEKEPGILIR